MLHRQAGPAGAPTVLSRPGNDLVQLAVSGRNDETFRAEGALAFAQDTPGAEICLLDGGRFLLESHLDAAAGHIGGYPEATLP